jgi:hypothetical protein
MTTDCGRDPAFAASPSSQSSLSRPSGVGELARLVRAASNVAGSEMDAPNFDAFLCELQRAVIPFDGMTALPPVGTVVQYFNPAYGPADNEHTGAGPYPTIVTKAWEYADSRMCNLAVVTPGKDTLAHVQSVPERGSQMDDGKYPSWEIIQ